MSANPTSQSVLNRNSNDKFILVLDLPPVLKKLSLTDNSVSIEPLQISVHGAVVPQVTVPSTEVRFGGQSYNVTSYSRPNYSPLTVNFIVDNQFKNYWSLWKWLNILNTSTGSLYGGTDDKYATYKDRINSGIIAEYQSNFSIFGLNEYNQRTIEIIYKNAFITGLGGINYSYRDSNLIESTAEFQYSQLDIKLLS